MKIISKNNPILFQNNHFANIESVPIDRYFIVDIETGELYTRNPQLVKTGEVLPSLVESELMYDNGMIRLKTVEEIQLEDNKKINDSFYNKKIELFIPNYDLLLQNGFTQMALSVDKNTGIDKINFKTENLITSGYLYLNVVKETDVAAVEMAIANGLLIKRENPVYDNSINANVTIIE